MVTDNQLSFCSFLPIDHLARIANTRMRKVSKFVVFEKVCCISQEPWWHQHQQCRWFAKNWGTSQLRFNVQDLRHCELMSTMLHSGMQYLSGDAMKDYVNVDSNLDVLWMFVKLDGDDIKIQSSDLRATLGCVTCHQPLSFVDYDKDMQSQGILRMKFGAPQETLYVVPVYWRTCSPDCAAKVHVASLL